MTQQTECPTVNVCINNCEIKMLVDTGSQLLVLNAAWMQRNKNYFKNTPILPIRNFLYVSAVSLTYFYLPFYKKTTLTLTVVMEMCIRDRNISDYTYTYTYTAVRLNEQ